MEEKTILGNLDNLRLEARKNAWTKEIDELEKFFADIELPKYPIQLNNHTTINNCKLFVKNHLANVKANKGNLYFLPYLNRLKELRELLKK